MTCSLRIRRRPKQCKNIRRRQKLKKFSKKFGMNFDLKYSGNSDITQGGDVALLAGDSTHVGQSEFSFDRGSRLRATLIVSDANGEVCRNEFRI